MAQRRKRKKPNPISLKKRIDHIHLWDIPNRCFPRKTRAKEYLDDLIRTTSSLNLTDMKVQYAAQICAFNIGSIIRKAGFTPSRPEVFREIREFAYHYENYCFRVYVYREKLVQFVNAILPVGYTEKEVRLRHILINPTVKQAGLDSLLKQFGRNSSILNVIKDRKRLTHQLYYGIEFDHYFRPRIEREFKKLKEFKKWCNDWKKEILSLSERTTECETVISRVNNSMSLKIVLYKEQLKKLQ